MGMEPNNIKILRRVTKTPFVFIFSLALVIMIGFSACKQGSQINDGNTSTTTLAEFSGENYDQLLNDSFRIDIKTIRVTLDLVPESYYIDCHATLTFIMRPGQTRALIHLNPVVNSNSVDLLSLNGESLSFTNEADVKVIRMDKSTQDAIEFQRDLQEGVEHTLEVAYRVTLASNQNYGFMSNVNDIQGRGNEVYFPTINAPQELARHYLTFRVTSDTRFQFIGSGLVEDQSQGPVQQWLLDTEREVASYTVMFVLLAQDDITYEARNIAGVDVRIMGYQNAGATFIESAFTTLETFIPELNSSLGPFPMPRGISIFLTGGGGGMEYFGGTITSFSALEHEVFHMYFACSTVNKTYRDTWLDEAINMWYENSKVSGYLPITDSFTSSIVGFRSPIANGFDTRAYQEGAHIIQAVAEELGSREAMLAFLKYLHQNYSYAPFNTFQFLQYLKDYSGVDMKDRFITWLYSTYNNSSSSQSRLSAQYLHNKYHKVDLSVPQSILDKYKK